MFTPWEVSNEIDMRIVDNKRVSSLGSCEKLRDPVHVLDTL
jgi:hypothetical protein